MRSFLLIIGLSFIFQVSFSQSISHPLMTRYCLEGKIGKNAPAILWFTISDSIVLGQVKYRSAKSQTAIKIIGYIMEDGSIKLQEFADNGLITGIFYCKLNSGFFSGTWFSPKTRKDQVFLLKNKDTVLQYNDTELALGEIDGHYHYSYGKGGAEGNLTVFQKSKSNVSVNFFNYTDAPSRNNAEVKLQELILSKNEIICNIDDNGVCKFKLRFFQNFVVVTYINDQRECGFGNGAEIDGVYLKINKKK